MILKNQEFDHEAKTVHKALNLTDGITKKCRERILFSSFANFLQREELYEDPDDAPKNMSTASGDLQRTLGMISDQTEYEYTLFCFVNTHQLSKMALSYYKFMSDISNSKQDRLKAKLLAMAADLKLREELKDEKEIGDEQFLLTPANLIKRITLVKQSHYNFDTYCNLISKFDNTKDIEEMSTDPDLDIDDLLKDILG
jgi:hypothetical protein